MTKLLIFTDIHITTQDDTIIGLDPLARLIQGLAHAQDHHPDAERIIITGDLTHNGTVAEYTRLKAALADVRLPVSLTLGNHDRRTPFHQVCDGVAVTDQGFVQQVIDTDDARLIVLDTLDEDAENLHGGLLCAHRLDWMVHAIKAAKGRRVILFMHHPPIDTGFDGMDAIGLASRADLAQRLAQYPNVEQIIAGHVHRTIQGALHTPNGPRIPVAIFKSTCHQMPMTLGDHDTRVSIDEPGAYGILLIRDNGIIVHTEDFSLPPTEGRVYNH